MTGLIAVIKSSKSILREFLQRETRLPRSSTRFWMLSGIETKGITTSKQHMYFVGSGERSISPDGTIRLRAGAVLSTGVFRNSFYHQLWQTHTIVKRIFLQIKAVGEFQLNVYQAASSGPPQLIMSVQLAMNEYSIDQIKLPDLDSLWPQGRIFWDIEAISSEVIIHSVHYVTDNEPVKDSRLVIMI